ncbi:PD-(D/E)XK nuclease family protein [Streptomyces europaeiscabiei]|uniref:PD-(D/E)XK nuclease family protein n=1 Tax=Streptomyces TaxID=1883 RepID=UPI000A36159B|nr:MULTISPECIES: PD-(D/E)XK nuclease family protein [Streptomyces]MDX3631146.1 PD-(D/E)XK nuclease family protein [Streptomyces europaeiscabiei]MDX3647626.1 PD-(D/E)XK nuclease family protein [Streptomyces europaeiscabiei]
MARPDPTACPTHLRTAVRPLLVADPAVPFRPSPIEDFGPGPLSAALDLWEHEGWPIQRVLVELRRNGGPVRGRGAPPHPALPAWTVEAFERYVAARGAEQRAARVAGLPPTEPVRLSWTARTAKGESLDARGAGQYEHTTWGRQYASADGSVRDLWIPSLGRAKPDRAAAEKAAIAYVIAQGAPTPRRRRGTEPPETATSTSRLPARVRVFDFGCADGSVTPLLDWGQAVVRERFAADAAPAFHEAATGVGTRPGASCVECKAISRCSSLRRTPGLWGAAPAAPRHSRRSVSAWDLRLHGECPAQYHLVRQLHLNDLTSENDGARRGRAVDAWLNERHGASPVRGCRDLPTPDESSIPPGFDLDAPLTDIAVRMMEEHRSLCPLNGIGQNEKALVQHRVTAYVPELDVVVLAVPDLLYSYRGRWIWRETKTSSRPLWEKRSLLRSYPQLALGVLLFSAGALDVDPRRSWVEFELLREERGASLLERIDPSRPENVAEAREVIAELAQPLLSDTSYEPRTGRHCLSCQARTWCRPGTAYVADHPPPPSASTPVPEADQRSRGV